LEDSVFSPPSMMPAEQPAEPPAAPPTNPAKPARQCATPSTDRKSYCTQEYGHLGPCFADLPSKRRRLACVQSVSS
jgi:hypothetical protein